LAGTGTALAKLDTKTIMTAGATVKNFMMITRDDVQTIKLKWETRDHTKNWSCFCSASSSDQHFELGKI